ncbi:hypothetical protein CI610_03493 [invertebrate metagenome]|uniref:Uncharacterized protein n=1 Tax=invertebrate metagenome TaxID=1711999 RepID=A0A2H9T2X5_9ZZZZ
MTFFQRIHGHFRTLIKISKFKKYLKDNFFYIQYDYLMREPPRGDSWAMLYLFYDTIANTLKNSFCCCFLYLSPFKTYA